uniref:Uncharacterized protein n=1 Tax=viral metagenome TaxID=1070528 RepID=A0A6C0J2S0_9ZZZZ
MTENDDKTPYDIEMYNGENTYLMGSSLLYLVPCTHAFYRQKYLLSSILFVGPLVSYKYWSKPRNNIWRTAYMICANLGMGLFIGNTAWNIHVPIYKYAIGTFYVAGATCYTYGSILHSERYKRWYWYHTAMHALMWLGHSLNICATQ